MLSSLFQKVRDVSVIKRLSFATAFLPNSMPNYWQTVADFSVQQKPSRNDLTAQQVKVLVENLEVMDAEAFTTEQDLVQEIIGMSLPGRNFPLGIVLISNKVNCIIYESELKVRADRASMVTVYDDRLGTLQATHFIKYCRKKGCSFQQYYSFSTQGDSSEVTYHQNWQSLPYFMSSRETVFSMDMLQRLDAEILIGQISYKQRADIYNSIHW